MFSLKVIIRRLNRAQSRGSNGVKDMRESSAADINANKQILGKWIASGWLFFFTVLLVTWWLLPQNLTVSINSVSARFSFAFAHIFLASLLLFVGFLAVGATRWQIETKDTSANPANSGNHAVSINVHNRVHTQFLSNTTEQFVMFAAAVLAATPFLTDSYLRIITLMTIMWIFGRFFFWGGYWYTAVKDLPTYPRAIGLGMGLLCTLSLASIAAIGISLHFPTFAMVFENQAILTQPDAFTFADIVIQPRAAIVGSNIFPIGIISIIVAITAALAVFPRLAPPVIPMALISTIGWLWLLFSQVIPIRF